VQKTIPIFLEQRLMAHPPPPSAGLPADEPRQPAPDRGAACQLCGIEVDAKGVRRTSSIALLGTRTELQIVHHGEVYRLTLTRSGKLLLQK
jgi:hemin uptake protein HemP